MVCSSYQKYTPMTTPFRIFSLRPSSSWGIGTTVPVDFRASTNTSRPLQSTLAQTPVKRPSTTKTSNTPSTIRSIKPSGATSSKQSPVGLDGPLRQRRHLIERVLQSRARITFTPLHLVCALTSITVFLRLFRSQASSKRAGVYRVGFFGRLLYRVTH
jgi:hypothetical protein